MRVWLLKWRGKLRRRKKNKGGLGELEKNLHPQVVSLCSWSLNFCIQIRYSKEYYLRQSRESTKLVSLRVEATRQRRNTAMANSSRLFQLNAAHIFCESNEKE